jgi:hypothetical protein
LQLVLPKISNELLEGLKSVICFFQIGVRGKDCVVLGVEKKSIPTLQDDRTIRKIHTIDEHVMLAFAGNFFRPYLSAVFFFQA